MTSSWHERTPQKSTGAGYRLGVKTYWFPVNKANREAAGVAACDTVCVRVILDAEPRVVTPPPDLLRELKKDKRALAAWEKLSYSHQDLTSSSLAISDENLVGREEYSLAGASDWFSRRRFSEQREYVGAIEEAKKPETRARRVRGAIEALRAR